MTELKDGECTSGIMLTNIGKHERPAILLYHNDGESDNVEKHISIEDFLDDEVRCWTRLGEPALVDEAFLNLLREMEIAIQACRERYERVNDMRAKAFKEEKT